MNLNFFFVCRADTFGNLSDDNRQRVWEGTKYRGENVRITNDEENSYNDEQNW